MRRPVKNKLLNNTLWIFGLQVMNYGAPFLVMPILTRSFSSNDFGLIMAAISLIAFNFILTDYGFGLSGTIKISTNRKNSEFVSDFLSNAFLLKLFLLVLSALSFLFLYYFGPFSGHFNLLLYAFFGVAAQAYQVTWVFQGFEMMRQFTYVSVGIKIVYVVAVFAFVNPNSAPSDVILYWSLSNSLGAAIMVIFLRKNGIRFRNPSILSLCKEVGNSFPFFLSRISVAAFTVLPTLILSSFSLKFAAIYAVAEQVYKAGQAYTSSLAQASLPYMSRTKSLKSYAKFIIFGFLCFVLGVLLVFVYSSQLVSFIFGAAYLESLPVIRVLLFTLLINYFSVLFGYPILSAINKVPFANVSIHFGFFTFGIFVLLLHYLYSIDALVMAFCVLFAEAAVFSIRVSYLFKNKRLLSFDS